MTIKKTDNELAVTCKSLEWSKAMYTVTMHLLTKESDK